MNAYPADWFAQCVLARIEKTPTCWLWTAATRGGYASISVPGGRPRVRRYAHRIVYEQMVGPIPDGMQLDHVWDRGCRHKHCVRPDHLEPVTGLENRQRWGRQTERCPQGHEYTASNTEVRQRACGRGINRVCITCRRDKDRIRKRAERAAGRGQVSR
jgi:hypothetical protein